MICTNLAQPHTSVSNHQSRITITHSMRSVTLHVVWITQITCLGLATSQSAPVSPLSALYSSPLGHVAQAQTSNGLLSVAKDHSSPTSPNSSVTGNSLTLSLNETASPLPRNGHTRLVSKVGQNLFRCLAKIQRIPIKKMYKPKISFCFLTRLLFSAWISTDFFFYSLFNVFFLCVILCFLV